MSSSQLEAQQRQLEAHEAKQVRLCCRKLSNKIRSSVYCCHACLSAGFHPTRVLKEQPTCSSCNAAMLQCEVYSLWGKLSPPGSLLVCSTW